MKFEPPMSPIASLRALKPESVVNSLDLVKDDMMNYVGSHDSISRLSLAVNDSAGGKTFDECYEVQELIGEGGYALVHRCEHKVRGTRYAVKEVLGDNYKTTGENIKEEIDALKRLREVPHIVRLLDVFVEPDRTCLVMEELVGGDLLDRIYEKEVYSEADARKLTRKLVEAIYFCHRKKIAHRDIKPENILLLSKDNDTNIKLADFGCAKFLTGPNCLRTLCGSPQYVAPELYTHTDGYDERCDLWSIGVVIYVLLAGYAPFEGSEAELPSIICDGYFHFDREYWKDISDPPRDLIKQLLKVDVDERLTAEQALDSEWLRRRDRESVCFMNGSVSAFDAWVRRQNESSQTFFMPDSLHSSRHSSTVSPSRHNSLDSEEEGDEGNEEEENDKSQRSLSVEDL